MENNIINTEKATLIINGGNNLKDCPTSYDEADKWAENANKDSNGSWERPEWSFDCGYKLDYDGAILRVTSRFYPPKTHYGETWDGTVTVCIFDKKVHKEKFDCKTLEELRQKVEEYVLGLRSKIEATISNVC